MLISAFASTQIAAMFGTAILTVLPATQFSGMMVPVSALSGMAQLMGRGFPMTYFVPISVGTFTKGLGMEDLWPDLMGLASSSDLTRAVRGFLPMLLTMISVIAFAQAGALGRQLMRAIAIFFGSVPRKSAASCAIWCCLGW